MAGTNLLLVVIGRQSEEIYNRLFTENGVNSVFTVLGKGTASPGILSILGLREEEKALLMAMTPKAKTEMLMHQMIVNLGINLPGNGIAMSIPVNSVGGITALKYFLGEQAATEATEVNNKVSEERVYPYDLIVSIMRGGDAEKVMDAARTAGAGGGTVLHAKGMADYSKKFFGITLASEKEMLLIVVRHSQKDSVMRAIMDKTGAQTDVNAMTFSLPVESVAGLRSVIEPQKDESENHAKEELAHE